MMSIIDSCILYAALTYNIPEKVIGAIIEVESKFNARAIGPVGEIGLMQVRPEYSSISRKKLFDPCTNVFEGTRKLAEAREQCNNLIEDTYVVCYNLGVAAGRRVRYPKLFPYYKKYKLAYELN